MNWNEPVTPPVLGLYRDDPRNVSLDGNGNLAIRATKEGDTYFTGRVESRIKIGINRTWEGRIQLPMAPGLWPAYWLVNIEDTPDGRGPLPDGESRHRRVVRQRRMGSRHLGARPVRRQDLELPTGGRSTARGTPTGAGGMRRASISGWTTSPDRRTSHVPAGPIDGAWPFNDPGYLLFTMLNLAVGGPGGGDPNFGAVSPAMLVDYIRVW